LLFIYGSSQFKFDGGAKGRLGVKNKELQNEMPNFVMKSMI
jgi:hypothetical protein